MRKRYSPQLNNKGSSLVTVIVAVSFIGILASMLMYMSMMNYQMKINNLKAKDSFYSAESVLDEIHAGMEEEVSAALQAAYREVLVNFDNTTVDEKQMKMRYLFLAKLQDSFAAGGDVKTYDLLKLYGYLDKTKSVLVDGRLAHGAVLETSYNTESECSVMMDGAGNYVDENSNPVSEAKGVMELYENSIVLRDIKVTYTDADGYVSIIETDMRISLPDMEFVQSVSLPALSSYSLVARENIEVIPVAASEHNLPGDNRIAGSFYAKRLLVGTNEAGEEAPLVHLMLAEAAGDANENKRMVVAEDILLNAGTKLTTDEYGELWADSIVMNGAHGTATEQASKVQFLGNDVYLSDDVLIQGDKNYFKAGTVTSEGRYKGKFIGYGAGSDNGDSSSIIINGTDTELHFEELTNLTLAGNAYIGLSDVNDALTQTDGVSNSATVEDVPMGQSVAVKSDQIAYLVPVECLGISSSTGEAVNSYLTNPMTLETYQEMMAHSDVIEVSDAVACKNLGGRTLADYGLSTTGSSPMYQKYFKRVSSEITLVYYYVMFDSDNDTSMRYANRYFQDYYKVNKSTLDAYNKLYTDSIQIRDSATGFYTLHLAGNMVRYDSEDTLSIKEATALYDDTNESYQKQLISNQSKFAALTKKLIDVYDLLTVEEKADSANVYTNLVDEAQIATFCAAALGASDYGVNENGSTVYYFGDDNGKAAVVDGDYIYTGVGDGEFKGLILATGNVTVTRDFAGTILCGGTITLDRNVSVQPDKDAVLNALTGYKVENAVKYYVTDFLLGGEGYLSEDTDGYLKSDVNLGELITYENWQKQ